MPVERNERVREGGGAGVEGPGREREGGGRGEGEGVTMWELFFFFLKRGAFVQVENLRSIHH